MHCRYAHKPDIRFTPVAFTISVILMSESQITTPVSPLRPLDIADIGFIVGLYGFRSVAGNDEDALICDRINGAL